MGPNSITGKSTAGKGAFQSSVRINVGPNQCSSIVASILARFQSSVRINVGPNTLLPPDPRHRLDCFNPP